MKSQNWDSAIDILYEGSLSLLKAGQGGSGGDSGCYLVDVFEKAERSVDAENKGKLLSILRAFPPEEPTKKKFVDEMIAWTSKFGEYPNGEPELHHVAGTLYAEGMTLQVLLASCATVEYLAIAKANCITDRPPALRRRASFGSGHERLSRTACQGRI